MSLEACVLILDNSQFSINGDYAPTRLQAQADAVHVIFNNKLRANPENEVGLMVMGGKAPEVLVTPTQDEGKLIAALHNLKQGGEADLSTAIQVAQLALKHRQNKNQRQRIIAFVGSPLTATSQSLVRLGKKMKKNNVSIDLISFGTDAASAIDMSIPSFGGASSSSSTSAPSAATPETNESKLQALHEAVNSSDNSHYLAVEPGPHLLSERISSSAILRGEGSGADDGMGGGGGGEDEFGIDPSLDPELAMALRMSLEEERARQAASNPAPASAPSLETVAEGSAVPSTSAEVPATPAPAVKTEMADDTAAVLAAAAASGDIEDFGMDHGDDGDDDLARALALSRGDDVEMGDGDGDDEDAEIARAIALSMQESEEDKKDSKLIERISSSAILRGGGSGADDGMGGGGGGEDEFGIDPSLDPELAMALRMSLEEERARQAALNPAPASAPSLETVAEGSAVPSTSAEVPATPAPAVKTEMADDTAAVLAAAAASGDIEDFGMDHGDDGDDDLARALALSRGDDVEMGDGDGDDEDAEIARARVGGGQE